MPRLDDSAVRSDERAAPAPSHAVCLLYATVRRLRRDRDPVAGSVAARCIAAWTMRVGEVN